MSRSIEQLMFVYGLMAECLTMRLVLMEIAWRFKLNMGLLLLLYLSIEGIYEASVVVYKIKCSGWPALQ